MAPSFPIIRSAALALAVSLSAHAADPARIVFQNGRSVPVNGVSLQGDKLVVKADTETFAAGQELSLQSADHIYGVKPPEIDQALAMLLTDTAKAKDARKILEPILAEHKITSKIPGNFWLPAAKVLLIIYSIQSDGVACAVIAKEISDATPAPGVDPIVGLGKALQMSPIVKFEERDAALRDQTMDNMPADVSAFAEFFRGELHKKENKNAQALDCFLKVTCLYPSGGLMINAAAEIKAADLLADAGRREEALALAKSALRGTTGTMLADEANKRLVSLK